MAQHNSNNDNNNNKLALVTGAAGFIATHIVKLLFERQYKVRGTVRNVSDKTKTGHLETLFPELQLFEADLLKDGSFDEAAKGVDVIFHTASPFIPTVDDPQRELVDPALKGTINLLNAAKRSGTVKRVVLTSSVAAVIDNEKPVDYIYSEKDWNLRSTVSFEPYRYSKRIAEEKAWEFVNGQDKDRAAQSKESFDLVVINPSFVLGPPLSSRTDATSVKTVKSFLDGSLKEKGTLPLAFPVVDVRDVALAHVVAAEKKEAKGRYLLTSTTGVPHIELVSYLKKSGKFDKYGLPDKEQSPHPRPALLDHSKAEKELGIQLRSAQESVVEMAQALIDLGIVPKPVD